MHHKIISVLSVTPHIATGQQVSLRILVDHADLKIEIEYVGQLSWFGWQTSSISIGWVAFQLPILLVAPPKYI